MNDCDINLTEENKNPPWFHHIQRHFSTQTFFFSNLSLFFLNEKKKNRKPSFAFDFSGQTYPVRSTDKPVFSFPV